LEINLPPDLDVSMLTICPKEPFFEWAKSLEEVDESELELELNDLKNDTSAYVVPPIESVADLQEIINSTYETMFNNELYGWSQDATKWPENRSVELFNDWFDLSVHSVAYDLIEDEEETQAS